MAAHNNSFSSSLIHDIPIPPQLFQATGNTGSSRDRDSITWSPQPCFPLHHDSRLGSLSRCHSSPACALDDPIACPGAKRRSHPLGFQGEGDPLHRLESLHGVSEPRSANPNDGYRADLEAIVDTEQRSLKVQHPTAHELPATLHLTRRHSRETSTPAPSFWSTTNPFATSHSSIQTDPSQLAPRDSLSLQSVTERNQSQSAETHQDAGNRRGTIHSMVNAIVPDILHRTLTNASYARKSSMWQTYERAKERGTQLQRHPYVQIGFEYSIYAIIILFTYFVLVGVPLWKGAVYWLWWVVANKFVLAGGFSITLGIALL
jgi:hypothetical protein